MFDGMDPRYKRVLWTVIAVNGVMFLTEMAAGQLAGSQALKADALDFLADTATYGLSLAVIGATLRMRATAVLFKGLSLLPKVGEGVNWGRRHIVGVFEPPLLHRRSDMPCPTITLSN